MCTPPAWSLLVLLPRHQHAVPRRHMAHLKIARGDLKSLSLEGTGSRKWYGGRYMRWWWCWHCGLCLGLFGMGRRGAGAECAWENSCEPPHHCSSLPLPPCPPPNHPPRRYFVILVFFSAFKSSSSSRKLLHTTRACSLRPRDTASSANSYQVYIADVKLLPNPNKDLEDEDSCIAASGKNLKYQKCLSEHYILLSIQRKDDDETLTNCVILRVLREIHARVKGHRPRESHGTCRATAWAEGSHAAAHGGRKTKRCQAAAKLGLSRLEPEPSRLEPPWQRLAWLS
ncbi:hypothetical protein B0H12DRAFT_1079961 [Mycena haematopus]|nr:hypothetical protein B0H12DRAFT_1079961 [Mycena haematopus]